MARRVGLFGGSFDPVHLGHVAAAGEAAGALGLEKVLMIPVGIPPHKLERTLAPAEDRLRMLELAAEGEELLEPCDIELRRPGPSYTIDTVRQLAQGFGEGVELCLIFGSDAVGELPTWKMAEALFREARPVVLLRPGLGPPRWEALDDLFGEDVLARLKQGVLLLEKTPAVSSTRVREAAASGGPLGGLVPGPVEEHIRSRGLYGAKRTPCSTG